MAKYILDVNPYIVSSSIWEDQGTNYYKARIEDAAIKHYNDMYKQATSSLKSNLNIAQIQSLKFGTENTKGAAKFLKQMDSSGEYMLEIIMRQIAERLNALIATNSSKMLADFDAIQKSVRASVQKIGSGDTSEATVRSFLLDLDNAMKLINQGGLPDDVYTNFFNVLVHKSNQMTPITKKDSEILEKVSRYLTNAAAKFMGNNGEISAESLGGTVSNIFNQSAGEPMVSILIGSQLEHALKQAVGLFDNVKGPYIKQIKSSVRQGENEIIGEKWLEGTTTQGKVDLLNTDVLSLTATLDDGILDIILSTNASIKWGVKKNVTLVNSTPITSLITEDNEKYWGYNAIAHRGAALTALRKGVAASFFNEWLTGSGKNITLSETRSTTDRVQFFIINGKVWSVYDIVNKVLERVKNQEADGLSISMKGLNSVSNDWEGSNAPSWEEAEKRSRKVIEVINTIKISSSLNANYLNLK